MERIEIPKDATPAAFGKLWLYFENNIHVVKYPVHFLTLRRGDGFETTCLELCLSGWSSSIHSSIEDMIHDMIGFLNEGNTEDLLERVSEDLLPDYWAVYRTLYADLAFKGSPHSTFDQIDDIKGIIAKLEAELANSRFRIELEGSQIHTLEGVA